MDFDIFDSGENDKSRKRDCGRFMQVIPFLSLYCGT